MDGAVQGGSEERRGTHVLDGHPQDKEDGSQGHQVMLTCPQAEVQSKCPALSSHQSTDVQGCLGRCVWKPLCGSQLVLMSRFHTSN